MCMTCGARKSHRTTGGKVSNVIRRAVQAGKRSKKAKTGKGLVNNNNKKKVGAPVLKARVATVNYKK